MQDRLGRHGAKKYNAEYFRKVLDQYPRGASSKDFAKHCGVTFDTASGILQYAKRAGWILSVGSSMHYRWCLPDTQAAALEYVEHQKRLNKQIRDERAKVKRRKNRKQKSGPKEWTATQITVPAHMASPITTKAPRSVFELWQGD